ncbi:hypothetical protein ENKNEFLB_00844 [Nocardioides aquaticus]|uniref:Uncharacterized protein n=1 Tax=Nocardioides aquaticus TaxID=160826 RepID=A0ABX8EHD1_9ACTN|nr:hypothetical protein ENKNEFLB_00844 [Nocardioides aquaticus]
MESYTDACRTEARVFLSCGNRLGCPGSTLPDPCLTPA